MKNFVLFAFLALIVITSCKKDENEIVYQTGFSSNLGWYRDTTEFYSCDVYQDKYYMDIDAANYYVYAIAPYENINFNYSISVDFSMNLNDTSMLGTAGILYNKYGTSYYTLFLVYNDRSFRVIKHEFNTSKMLLVSTFNSNVLKDFTQLNNLKVIQKSNSMEFRINNITVGTLPLAMDNPGVQAGLIASSLDYPYFTKFTAFFDNFMIRKN